MARLPGFPKPQTLRQKHERDWGVCVFAKLTGITEVELLKELPDAYLRTVSVDDWEAWLERKGYAVTRRPGSPDDIIPCAHLVGHGVYTREDATGYTATRKPMSSIRRRSINTCRRMIRE